jgi:alkylation response protein AidB-like acyl-CoA dehydrogenase
MTEEQEMIVDALSRFATKECYLAKIYADDIVLNVTDGAVQVLGGHGYVREHPVEMWLRNSRGFASFDGMAMV